MTATLYTWGYYGWGNATPQLVQAVDAVEESRGFAPPLFVDTRIRRSVRAAGFNGSAFAKLLGDRYRWMKSLGNRFIETRTGPFIQIADPASAAPLLALGLEASKKKQRLLFFCGCRFPREDGKTACHRDTVASLVLQEAAKQKEPIEIIEWPGGEYTTRDLEVTKPVLTAVRRGRTTVPLSPPVSLATWCRLPWGSILSLVSDSSVLRIVTGPAGYQRGEWLLPVFNAFADPETDISEIERTAAEFRKAHGFDKHE